MITLRLGTRSSQLALAQANIVKELIETQLDYNVEIEKISTLGDKDTISQLHQFRGQGVFTSSLEKKLLTGSIDIAVHSLKDLPIENNPGLDIVAYIERHNATDCLLIKEKYLISENPLIIKDYTRIATGSPRRQSQLMSLNSNISFLDIRGNINTRISRLLTPFIDGLIVASAVFDRLKLILPSGIKKIELPLDTFPTTPGQGVIAVQARKNEFDDLKVINNEDAKITAITEREVMKSIGGGCQLSFGLHISNLSEKWYINCSVTSENWNLSKGNQLSRFTYCSTDLKSSIYDLIKNLSVNQSNKTDISNSLRGKRILIARNIYDSNKYKKLLVAQGAITASIDVFDYHTNFYKLQDPEVIKNWKNASWIVLTSQRAVEFLDLIHKIVPRSSYRIAVIGSETARAIRSIQLPVHIIANGSLSDLQELLVVAREIYPGNILFLSGEHISGLPSPDAIQVPVYNASEKNLVLPFKSDYLVTFSARSSKIIIEQLGVNITNNWVAIGQRTSKFLHSQKINSIVAKTPTPQGVIDAIIKSQGD